MPALLCDSSEVKKWLGETDGTMAEVKALLRPYDGSLIIREQESSKPPPKPKKPKAAEKVKQSAPNLF